MEMSETINELADALAKAQSTIAGAAKDRENPAFKQGARVSKYADLTSVWEAWQAVGPAQGLAVSQLPGAIVDGKVTLTTMLSHKSGQWMRETLAIPVTKQDAQGYGSALTYARRYALASFVGIAPEDDDGNGAVGRGRNAPAANGNETGEVINAAQVADLRAALDASGRDVARFCQHYQIEALPDLPVSKFAAAMAAIAKPKKAA